MANGKTSSNQQGYPWKSVIPAVLLALAAGVYFQFYSSHQVNKPTPPVDPAPAPANSATAPATTTAPASTTTADYGLKLGTIAPDFTLVEAHDLDQPQRVTLSKLTADGPVLVIFYLSYQCERCVSHLKEIGDLLPEFQKAGFAVVAISPDTPKATRDSLNTLGDIPLLLLSDPDGKVAKSYGLLAAGDQQLHGTFVIGRDGKIKFSEAGDHPFTNYQDMLAAGAAGSGN